MNQDPRNFPQNVHIALGDKRLKSALVRLKSHFSVNRRKSIDRYGDFEALREAGKSIRDYAINNLDTMLVTFEKNVVARGGRVSVDPLGTIYTAGRRFPPVTATTWTGSPASAAWNPRPIIASWPGLPSSRRSGSWSGSRS